MTSRNKPGVAFWATVVAVCLPLFYVVSFGPACWIASRTDRGAGFVNDVYQPIMRLWFKGQVPPSGGDWLEGSAGLFASTTKQWYIRINLNRQRYEWSAR